MYVDIITNFKFQMLSMFVILRFPLVLGFLYGFFCLLDKSAYVLYKLGGCGVIGGIRMGAKREVYR